MTTSQKILDLFKESFQVLKNINKTYRLTSGTYYAHVFESSIIGCSWLSNTPFSPGRWALTYQELYVLFRILQTIKPQSVMDIGLGQSSILLSKYCAHHPHVLCTTVEHDQQWVDFFKTEHEIPANLTLQVLPLVQAKRNNHSFYKYGENLSQFIKAPLELLIVDGPWGAPHYSRSQCVELVPQFINREKFVIIVDDIQRKGEQETVKLLLQTLNNSGLPYKSYRYRGEKDFFVICSPNLGFLLSL